MLNSIEADKRLKHFTGDKKKKKIPHALISTIGVFILKQYWNPLKKNEYLIAIIKFFIRESKDKNLMESLKLRFNYILRKRFYFVLLLSDPFCQ